MSNWKVTAIMSSPIAGDVPYLDGLLEFEMAQRQGKAYQVQRCEPCPPIGAIHIPCLRGDCGEVRGIPRCSAPIYTVAAERHEHFAKRIAVEHASLLSENQRLVVATGNSWTKSYRLPVHTRSIEKVVWFVGGSKRQSLRSLLKSVHSLGKKRSQGFGRVAEWDFEEVEHDWSWFAKVPEGTVLMRRLPFCEQLPKDLIGYKRTFGGVAAPLWHPDRQMEIVVPC
jgi:hypothetical protein